MPQTTVGKEIRLDGVNVFNGKRNYAVIHSAKAGQGITFRYRGEKIPATLANARYVRGWRGMDKSVALQGDRTRIGLIEHFVPGLVFGGDVDNADVELSDGVCPTTDYCALDLLAELEGNVVPIKGSERKFLKFEGASFSYSWSKGPDRLTVSEADKFTVRTEISYPHDVLAGNRNFEMEVTPTNFRDKVAAARPPAFTLNWPFMYFLGLVGKLPLVGHGVTRKNYLLLLGEKSERYGNPRVCGARYNGGEFVRHKNLDDLAALSTTGRWKAKFDFNCTGHEFDLEAMRALMNSNQVREVRE